MFTTIDLRVDADNRCWTLEGGLAPSLYQLVSSVDVARSSISDIMEVAPAIGADGRVGTSSRVVRARPDKKLPNSCWECKLTMDVIVDESMLMVGAKN